ncbi:unnamed protein product [Alternaria alternata]
MRHLGHQKSQGERKKGKTVIQASPDSLSIVENQMSSLCEGPTLGQGKPPSTLTRTTTTQSLQSFQTALTTIRGHSPHRLEGPATPSVEQLQRMKPSVRTNQSGSLPVGFRRDPLNANRGLSKLFVHGRMFPPAPKHLSVQTWPDNEVEVSRTAQGSDKEEVQSPVRRDVRRPTKTGTSIAKEETWPREGTQSPETRRNLSQVPQKEGPSDEGESSRSPSRMLEVPSAQAPQEQAQEPTRRPTAQGESIIALERKRRWSWTPRSRKAKKTTPFAVALIDRVSSPSMTTPDLPAQLTSRVQEHHQNRPPEMKATKEGLQHQMQEKRHPLRENTSVDQPQHERETSRPSSLQRRIQRSPQEGLHHQSRERKHDVDLQQLGKIERQSRREHPQSPEHQRERQQSHRVPDKQIVEDNPPPRERVHQSRVRPYSTTKRNQSKQEELNHHHSKKNEAQPRQPRHKQIGGHPLRPERVWQYPEQLYQDQRQQEKEGMDLLRQRHKDSLGTISPVPASNTGASQSGPQPTKGSLATNQPADRSPEQQTQPGARTDVSDVKPALPRRVTSYGMYESSSSDPYTMPASGPRKAAALASSNANASANASPITQQVDPKSSPLTRRDSLKPRRSPTSRISELFGRDKTGPGIGSQQQRQQQAPTPAAKPLGAVTSGFGLTSSPAVKGLGRIRQRNRRKCSNHRPKSRQRLHREVV